MLSPSQGTSTTELSTASLEYACRISILSRTHRIDAQILPTRNSYCDEDIGYLKTWRDNTWYTLNGSPIGDGELQRRGNTKLALPDFSFRSDVDASVRFVVVYETRWREVGNEDWVSVVRWKRTFVTKEEACEGYWWGARQGWSIPFVYVEASAREPDEQMKRR